MYSAQKESKKEKESSQVQTKVKDGVILVNANIHKGGDARDRALSINHENISELAIFAKSIGFEFSTYSRLQAYTLVGINEFVNTDIPNGVCTTLDIAEPGLTTECLKKFKRTVLRFHPDRYPDKKNGDDLFRLFRHAYAYFKSAVKNREKIQADPFAFPTDYQSADFVNLIEAAVSRDQPFSETAFNQEYDRRHQVEEADRHGWWRDPSAPTKQRLDPSAYTFLTPEQTQTSMQLVIRQHIGNGEMIIPANMGDGYYTAASSSKLPYDDIRKVYHDKTWTNLDALQQEFNHRIRGNVLSDYSARVNTYK